MIKSLEAYFLGVGGFVTNSNKNYFKGFSNGFALQFQVCKKLVNKVG